MHVLTHDDLAVVTLEAGKANAMDEELLVRLIRLFDDAEADGARAIVLTGYGKYFSGGLALPSLVKLDRPAMKRFMELFHTAILRVYSCRLPVIAAINGHAIAGGCVLALQADARIMADGEMKIGLNEVQLGIGLPSLVIETARLALPVTSMGPIVQEGNLFAPRRAKELGLVDEVVPPGELEARAKARAKELGALPPPAYAQVKSALRRPALEVIQRLSGLETEFWLDTWFSEPARTQLQAIASKLGTSSR
jgi:enoyl-CoA hydratase